MSPEQHAGGERVTTVYQTLGQLENNQSVIAQTCKLNCAQPGLFAATPSSTPRAGRPRGSPCSSAQGLGLQSRQG